MKDTNSKLNIFSSKVRPWKVENRPTINSRWLSWALLDLSWGYLGAILGISWAQDNPKTAPREPQMPLLCYLRAILGSQDGSLGLSWGYLTLKIDLEMAQKVWVFSSETDLGFSSCLLSCVLCVLLSWVFLMLSSRWRAIKLASLARDKIFKRAMFGSLGAVHGLSTPKISPR